MTDFGAEVIDSLQARLSFEPFEIPGPWRLDHGGLINFASGQLQAACACEYLFSYSALFRVGLLFMFVQG
jgi:hypothetical protein